ncbi:MAG: diguanylate cyclase domain-containing protein, partial [Actinomycetales bacterium]
YGLDYGDAVIDSTAQIMRSLCADGDQAARWSGDTFLVLGFGPSPDMTAFTDRVNQAIADSGIALGKLPVEVRTEVVAGREESFQALLTRLVQGDAQGR